jgi:hypothetical protein
MKNLRHSYVRLLEIRMRPSGLPNIMDIDGS